jgi:glycosyltransferase involved in cell wall biosynthesis
MTVYKGLPYLREAIDSVLSQSYADFEFLIVNDASPDNSSGCIESYKDSRIRLLQNERNLGQAGSLNRGLSEARGGYVARLDQDDVCLPYRLEKQVAYLESRPEIAVVGSWAERIDSRSRRIGWLRERSETNGEYLANLLLSRCPLHHPSVMFRRDVVRSVGGYDCAYAPAEDYELWLRLAVRGYKAAIIHDPLVMLRAHGQRQSATKESIQRANNNRAHQAMIDLFCRPQEAAAVGSLLRSDWEFWVQCNSIQRICAALDALDQMVGEIAKRLSLGSEDSLALRHVLYRWVGPGASLRKTLQHFPSFLFYPVFVALCPLLIPNARLVGARVIDRAQRVWCALGGG